MFLCLLLGYFFFVLLGFTWKCTIINVFSRYINVFLEKKTQYLLWISTKSHTWGFKNSYNCLSRVFSSKQQWIFFCSVIDYIIYCVSKMNVDAADIQNDNNCLSFPILTGVGRVGNTLFKFFFNVILYHHNHSSVHSTRLMLIYISKQ